MIPVSVIVLQDVFSDRAVDIIRNRVDGEPIFLFVSYTVPHTPVQVSWIFFLQIIAQVFEREGFWIFSQLKLTFPWTTDNLIVLYITLITHYYYMDEATRAVLFHKTVYPGLKDAWDYYYMTK